MTGSNPGTHGIFGFTDLKPNSYSLRFPNFRDVKNMTIWDRLENRRKRSVILNQPGTYPARETKGVLVSGFVAIDMRKAIYPLKYRSDLEKMGYMIDVDTVACREDHDLCIQQLNKTLEGRRKAVELFWESENWDYFQVVITGTDRLHHYLWDALDDPNHRYHRDFLEYYSKVDEFVGWLFGKYEKACGRDDPLEGFFMLSDHGFTGIKQEVYLSRWLQDEGYLLFESSDAESLEDITEDSRVFALDPGRLYINRKGRLPKGSVSEEEIEPLLNELTERLLALEFSGEKVIESVNQGRQIYSGSYVEDAPDLVLVPNYGYDLKAGIKADAVFSRSSLVGMHTWNDAFLLSKSPASEDVRINDVAGLILDTF